MFSLPPALRSNLVARATSTQPRASAAGRGPRTPQTSPATGLMPMQPRILGSRRDTAHRPTISPTPRRCLSSCRKRSARNFSGRAIACSRCSARRGRPYSGPPTPSSVRPPRRFLPLGHMPHSNRIGESFSAALHTRRPFQGLKNTGKTADSGSVSCGPPQLARGLEESDGIQRTERTPASKSSRMRTSGRYLVLKPGETLLDAPAGRQLHAGDDPAQLEGIR
jgi:hypothetical protein